MKLWHFWYAWKLQLLPLFHLEARSDPESFSDRYCPEHFERIWMWALWQCMCLKSLCPKNILMGFPHSCQEARNTVSGKETQNHIGLVNVWFHICDNSMPFLGRLASNLILSPSSFKEPLLLYPVFDWRNWEEDTQLFDQQCLASKWQK